MRIRFTAVRLSPKLLRASVAGVDAADIREMAVPSYCHWNPLIRRLFWARLDSALTLASVSRGERVLDFGCGTGVLFPSLLALGADVIAVDTLLSPAREMSQGLSLPVQLVHSDDFAVWVSTNQAAVDCVLALDVLEHVGDAELIWLCEAFRGILRSGGRLVISGGTETRLYKLGRLLAGFRNEYHHRSILAADAVLRQRWERTRLIRLPPRPLPCGFFVARYVVRVPDEGVTSERSH